MAASHLSCAFRAWRAPWRLLAGVGLLVGAFEAVLALTLEAATFGCPVHTMTLRSRIIGAAIVALAVFACSWFLHLARASAGPRRRILVTAALGTVVVAVASMALSYRIVTVVGANRIVESWLGVEYRELQPSVFAGPSVVVKGDLLGDVVEVRSRGRIVRSRLSLGPWQLEDPDDLVSSVRIQAGLGGS